VLLCVGFASVQACLGTFWRVATLAMNRITEYGRSRRIEEIAPRPGHQERGICWLFEAHRVGSDGPAYCTARDG
jgi:hypothetical protein